MKSYSGNQSPYVYMCSHNADAVEEYLQDLSEKGINFCLASKYSRKEETKIAKAYGVLFFLSRELISDPDFRKLAKAAIDHNKNILCVYLEELKLDAELSMEFNSQQALFFDGDKEKIKKDLLKAEIFNDMRITKAQIRTQRLTVAGLIMVFIAAALSLYSFIIYPLLIEPKNEEKQQLARFGLDGVSDEDLKKITSLHIVGDKVFAGDNINKISSNEFEEDGETVVYYSVERIASNGHLYWSEEGKTSRGTIEDISIIAKMENLQRLSLCSENISDLTPIFSLKNLEGLCIDGNPVSDLSGIENCSSLERIEMRQTYVKDLTPLFNMPSLDGIWVAGNRYVSDISGIEDTDFNALELYGTHVKHIDHLPHNDWFMLNLGDHMDDYSFLLDNNSYSYLFINKASVTEFMPYLKEAEIDHCVLTTDLRRIDQINFNIFTSLEIESNVFYSLENIEKVLPELEELDISDCSYLGDLSPILKTNIRKLILKEEQLAYLSEGFRDAGIEITYIDSEGNENAYEY